ncbi:Protein male-specific lethal-3 [Eumeta japonica]|uniref:Protein male-specific lethal-3 n=1 Tax=Eumeta variegata TaxID=151549 RepID=A0A4C1VM62_EUMVA|nr:Protein male-specific lethal-3 [Eumeta japonica]
MVSTRGVRYKFSEGERVLCYEPDPTKAKVLYDSKVLEVIENKDKRGRRTVEYLIHFQGWNSSWDRCVSEDFVLKDTEENRQLQRDLAEKSQLQLINKSTTNTHFPSPSSIKSIPSIWNPIPSQETGNVLVTPLGLRVSMGGDQHLLSYDNFFRGAYLYRRERKKGPTNAGAGPSKRARHTFDDDGSSSSTQPDDRQVVLYHTEGEAGDTDESSGSGPAQVATPPPPPPPQVLTGRAHITLPSALRDRLTFDYHLVVKRGRLSRLPASPCVADILESFVRWYARAGAWQTPAKARGEQHKPDLLDVSSRLNLVREVADGLRVYFDFALRGHLLYKHELTQYHEICGLYLDKLDDDLKEELQNSEEETIEAAEIDMKSPKLPEYAHLPPDPAENIQEGAKVPLDDPMEPIAPKTDTEEKSVVEQVMKMETDEICPPVAGPAARRDSPPPARPAPVGRRLRSHKHTSIGHSEMEEPMPSTSSSVDPRGFENFSSSVGSSGSSISEGWGPRAALGSPPAQPGPRGQAQMQPVPPNNGRTKLSQLFDMVANWKVISRDGTDHLPCRIYGAIHFARLFVKLPDFLNATQMPDAKLKMILKYIDMFVQ